MQESLCLERAKVLDRAIKDLGSEISTFKTLVNRADAISEAGNVLQSETNEARLKADTEARAALSKQANTKGPISDALTEAARKYREDGKLADAARAFADAVRRESSLGEGRGPQAGPARDGDGQAQASGPEPVSAGIAGREQTQAEGVDAARAAPRKPASEPSKTIGSAKDPLRKKGDW
ncbi:hypothetical protein [Ruegeria alba]|uniref:hypothetical protein n=1 Tax=Ruegeria alba TaxID=2916756 RepID=UPI001EEF7150|nr:hypothetical protein [Ruegeria alba]